MPHQYEQDLHEYGDPWHEKSDWLHRVRNAVISRQPLATLPKVLSFETSLLKVPATQWLDLLRYARRKWLLYHRLQPDDVRGWKPRWAKQIPRARATCKHWGGRAASEKSKLLIARSTLKTVRSMLDKSIFQRTLHQIVHSKRKERMLKLGMLRESSSKRNQLLSWLIDQHSLRSLKQSIGCKAQTVALNKIHKDPPRYPPKNAKNVVPKLPPSFQEGRSKCSETSSTASS